MIGSNLYVGDFGDYQADELLEFQSNFNLQLWFFTGWKILKHFFSFNRDLLWVWRNKPRMVDRHMPSCCVGLISDCYFFRQKVILCQPEDRPLCHYQWSHGSEPHSWLILSRAMRWDFTSLIYFQYVPLSLSFSLYSHQRTVSLSGLSIGLKRLSFTFRQYKSNLIEHCIGASWSLGASFYLNYSIAAFFVWSK